MCVMLLCCVIVIYPPAHLSTNLPNNPNSTTIIFHFQTNNRKDISSMLFFDSNFLCVDGFVDAHCLWRRKTEKIKTCPSFCSSRR